MENMNKAMKRLQESKIIKEDYTARQEFEAGMKKYLAGGEGRSEDDIKILAETDNYILIGSVNEKENENDPDMIHLDVLGGSYRNVDVYIDQNYKGKVTSAKVNWSAIGSVGVETAEEFVKHINDALKLIKEIDGKDYSSEFNK